MILQSHSWAFIQKERKWSCSVMSDSLRPHDRSLAGSSVHGIFQARVQEWGAIAFSDTRRGPYQIGTCHLPLSSVQFSCSVVSDSLQPRGLQHTRPPCPSPTPGVYSNSCPLSRWCHPTSSSSGSPSLAFNLSQHQGLFKWVRSSHQVAKVMEFQQQSFQWIFRTDFL